MLGARLLVTLLSGATLMAVFAAGDTSDDYGLKRTKRGGGYEYVDYVPSSYEPKSSHYSHESNYGSYGKHYHHHHHSHKYHCKHCHKKHDKKSISLHGLLALLAPLALLPLLTGAIAPISMAPLVVPAMTQVIAGTAAATAGRRRRRRATQGSAESIHEYLQKVNPSGEYNDEVMAQYLKCSGMLDSRNHCLDRLTCQYTAGTLGSLEKEVASLIIYTIVKNKYIPESFKDQMKKAAAFGRQSPLRCYAFRCDNKKDVFSSFK